MYESRVLYTVIYVYPVHEAGDIGPLSAARGSIPPVCKYTNDESFLFYTSHRNLIFSPRSEDGFGQVSDVHILNAQSRWPLRIWHCQCIMNHLKEIDKEEVHFTIDLAPGLSLHRIHCMHQNQACFPVHKGIRLILLHGKPEEVRERIIKIGSAFGRQRRKRAEPDIAEHGSLIPSSLVALAVSPSRPPATSKLASLPSSAE